MFDFDRVLSLATMLCTAVTAVAAVLALTIWRRQVQGQTQHDLAKRLAGAMHQLGKARKQARADLEHLQRRGADVPADVPKDAIANAVSLDDLHTSTEQLEADARVVWGKEVASVISKLRQGANYIGRYVRAKADDNPFAQLPYCDLDGVDYLGEAFPKRMDQLDDLLQDWLGQHVGRVGAKAMSLQQLLEREREIENAVAHVHSREWSEKQAEWAESAHEEAIAYEEDRAIEKEQRERFDRVALPEGVEQNTKKA